MKTNLKKELKKAFDPPVSTGKKTFLSNLNYPKGSNLDFITSQIGYIRKRVWILSVLLFIGTLTGLHFYKVSVNFVWILSSLWPFISLTTMNEIFRSSMYHMDELEMSCKHNFLKIGLVRLGILGGFNLAVWIGILLLLIGKVDFGFIRLGLYLIVPYLLNCYGSLFIVNRLKSREISYICGVITAFVTMLNSLLVIQINTIYTEKYRMFWCMAFIILTLLTSWEVKKLIKKMEELQWNSLLTI